MHIPSVVWSFCNLCERMYANEDLLQCENCGDNFCPFCDSMSQYSSAALLLDREEYAVESFCSRVCRRAYEGGYRRTLPHRSAAHSASLRSRPLERRRRQGYRRYDSDDDSEGSSSPIGR